MATIKSQLSLNDGVSGVLRKITAALDTTLASFEQIQRASGAAVDVAAIETARGLLVESNADLERIISNTAAAAKEQDRFNESINRGASAMDGMVTKVASMAGAYMSVSGIKGLAAGSMTAADTQINAQVQLRTVLDNMGATGISQAITAYDAIVQKAGEIQGRGIYGDEAMIAGAAEFATYFSDANAILSMMGTLTDYAMGMSGGGALDSTAMVNYAANLGQIMSGSYEAMTEKGFAFTEAQKAIIEGTATEQQIISTLGAEYLNLSSDMQAAAAINSVIAEGWGGLYETMSSTPEGAIIRFNNTLGDIQEVVGAGIYPAVINLVNTVQQNMPQIETAALGLATVLGTIVNIVSTLVGGAISFGSAAAENWSWIAPILWGVVAALVAYNAVSLITNAVNGAMALSAGVKAAADMMSAGATFAATVAQYGLNAALLACPITWIVIAVIALIAGIVALCSWIAKTTGAAQTGLGVLLGGLSVARQACLNAGFVVANVFLGIWSVWGALCSNIGTAFHNVIANVQGQFYDLLFAALTVVAGICEALNKLPFVEFDYSGITGKADEYAAKSAAAYGSKEAYASITDAFNEGFHTFNAFSEGWASDAFNTGAAWGDGIMDKMGGFFDGFTFEPGSIDGYANSPVDGFLMEGLSSGVDDIADNTGAAADALEISGEELEYLRDIAERDAINRFTTAEVKIDMTGMTNRIDGATDIDGVIRELTDGFTDALLTAAEGVHV